MEIFSYGIEPVLGYLEKRLCGILIHSIPVHGPILNPCSTTTQAYNPPPTLSSLPDLPPIPPGPKCTNLQYSHTLPPLETRYTYMHFVMT